MNLNKILLLIVIISVFLGALFFLRTRNKKNTEFTIGILQTASHPALDNVREGFIKNIEQKLGKRVRFIVQNAQGSVVNAHTIAQSFHADSSINLIFAIATLAAQAIAGIEQEKPIVFAAVTSPKIAGLVQKNITGVTDAIDISAYTQLITSLAPDAKRVAIIYNNAEVNAIDMAVNMQSSLQERGLSVVRSGISNQMDIMPALTSVLGKVDVVALPLDNMVALTISVIAQHCLVAKKPLFVSDNLLVKEGALAACGVDYIHNGTQAAQYALDILIGHKKPADLPIVATQGGQTFINKKTADQLSIIIPDQLLRGSILI